MVRHGESPKEGNERTRGLTEKGHLDAQFKYGGYNFEYY